MRVQTPFYPIHELRPRYVSGRWYGLSTGTTSSDLTLVANRLYATFFPVAHKQTWDRIGLDVQTAGGGGELARLGLYSLGTDGLPGALMLDAGTVAVDGTGDKEIVISHTLAPGWYFVALLSDSSTAKVETMNLNVSNRMFGGSTPAGQRLAYVQRSQTFGALPDPFGGSLTFVTGASTPQVSLRTT